jgi:Protein of unknown function (DUF3617)
MTSNKHRWASLVLVSLGVLTVVLRAQFSALNVKLGLWEITSTTQTTGTPAIDLSTVPPEYRGRAEAAMKAQMEQSAKPNTRVRKACVTKENLQKDLFQNASKDPSCKWTTIAQTSSVGEFTIECTGVQQVSGHIRYEALNSENVKGTMTMKIATAKGASPMTSNTTLTSRWIGASCGDVK